MQVFHQKGMLPPESFQIHDALTGKGFPGGSTWDIAQPQREREREVTQLVGAVPHMACNKGVLCYVFFMARVTLKHVQRDRTGTGMWAFAGNFPQRADDRDQDRQEHMFEPLVRVAKQMN